MSLLPVPQAQSLTPAAQAMTLAEKMRYCEVLSGANMLPAAYAGNPGNVLVAMELGNALGLEPIVAMMDIYVVKNRPSMSAKLMNALARRAGHRIKVDFDAAQATCTIVRKDDAETVYRNTFSLEDAKKANLIPAKPDSAWSTYPKAMMCSRAISACVRIACPEVMLGMYTPEELGGTDHEMIAFVGTPATAIPTQDPGFKAISAPAPKPKAKKPEPKPEPVADTGASECPDAVEAEVVISEPAQTVEAKAVEVFGAPAPEPTPPPANTGQKAKLWREMRRVFGSQAESDGMAWLRAYCAVSKLPLMANGMPDVDSLDKATFEDAMFALVDKEQSMKDNSPTDDGIECPL